MFFHSASRRDVIAEGICRARCHGENEVMVSVDDHLLHAAGLSIDEFAEVVKKEYADAETAQARGKNGISILLRP